MKKKERRENTHTGPGARQQNGAGRQVPDPDKETDLTHKTRYQKERRVSHQKRKTDKTSLPPASTQTQTTCMREESHPKDKNKKEKPHDTFPPHQPQHPATPADTQTRIQSLPHTSFLHPCHHPSLHPIRILSTLLTTPCYHSLPTYRPPLLYHHLCLYYMSLPYHRLPAPCTQLYPCLSRSRYRSTSTCVPLPDGRYGPPPPGYHMLTCILLLSHCYLHTVHMSVCTTVLTLLQHPAYRLGFSPCAHHSPSFSPFMCHPGHLRYHQSLTRVHSHSLPVPPPLPLADARSQGGSTVGRSRSLACGLWCPLVLCGSPCW